MNEFIFNNVEIFGYNHQNNFFGEKSFNYSFTKTISIRGRVIDLQNNNFSSIFSNVQNIKIESKDFKQFIINNQNYGVGKIISLNFENGTWVNDARYEATIEILEEVPLQSLEGDFSSISLKNKNVNLIQNFSENFSLDFNLEGGIVGGKHSIEVEYNSNDENKNVIILAKQLALELLKTLPSNLSQGNYLNREEKYFQHLYTENYDLINGKCGFTKNFSYRQNNNQKPFSVNRTILVNISKDGVSSVEEQCEIKAETNLPSLYENAVLGYKQEITNAFGRCLSLYSVYKSQIGTSNDPLNIEPVQKTTQINKPLGVINYTIIFDNDPKKQNIDYWWENTMILDQQENYVNIVSEEGSIIGKLKIEELGTSNQFEQKYLKSKVGWNLIKNNIFSRISNMWNTYATVKASNSLKEFKKNINHSPYQGQINYNISYTDDFSILNESNGIRKLSVNFENNNQVPPLFKDYLIPNNGYAIRQNLGLKEQGTATISVKAEIAFKDNREFYGIDYFNALKSYTNLLGGAQDLYIESVNFEADEVEQNASYTVNYKYS
jgi:hypothetical protein